MRKVLWSVTVLAALGCGAGSSTIGGSGPGGGNGGGMSAGTGGGTSGQGGGGGTGGTGGSGGTGGGASSACPDNDKDGVTTCQQDCNDADPAIKPGAMEVANGKDDDCNQKIDDKIPGNDTDKDGTPYPADCDDNEPLVGPMSIEDPMNMVDDNCNGQVDEAAVDCESQISGTGPGDFARAIGVCGTGVLVNATFDGDVKSRGIRAKYGNTFSPLQGAKMAMLSSGLAIDNNEADAGYRPQNGFGFGAAAVRNHPFYTDPKCAKPAVTPKAEDLSEVALTLKVPQNANSLSFNFAFFSAEYPEYVCTEFNDRFLALLTSSALDASKTPTQCKTTAGQPATCNLSFDMNKQPVSVNNGFFDICQTYQTNMCTKPVSGLAKTGYEIVQNTPKFNTTTGTTTQLGMLPAGGSTGWLSTQAPVKPGETITLRFIVFDEGDSALDSSVLIDNFKWQTTSVAAPVTSDPGIN